MNILMLCNKSPYPPSEGGPMAMNSIVNGLLEAGHKVKILAVNSEKYHIKKEDIPQSYRDKTGIELVDVDLKIKPIEALKNLYLRRIQRETHQDLEERQIRHRPAGDDLYGTLYRDHQSQLKGFDSAACA